MGDNPQTELRACIPILEKIKKQVRGDSDLEMVVQRIEQIELFLEGLAELKAAQDHKQRVAAELKVAGNRHKLEGPIASAGQPVPESSK